MLSKYAGRLVIAGIVLCLIVLFTFKEKKTIEEPLKGIVLKLNSPTRYEREWAIETLGQTDPVTVPPEDAASVLDPRSRRAPSAWAQPVQWCQGRTGRKGDIRQHSRPARWDRSSTRKEG